MNTTVVYLNADEMKAWQKIQASKLLPDNFKIFWQKPYKRCLANQTKSISVVEKLFTI